MTLHQLYLLWAPQSAAVLWMEFRNNVYSIPHNHLALKVTKRRNHRQEHSKRGNRHLRRAIWQMATKVIQFNERFKQYHLKRIKDGLPYKMAVLATPLKLIRVMFAMLRNKTLFNATMN